MVIFNFFIFFVNSIEHGIIGYATTQKDARLEKK